MMQPTLLRIIDVFLEGAQRPLVVIVGCVASGKIECALDLAEYVNGEIVHADAGRLYQHLDVGTSKTRLQRNIPHHLLDLFDPREEVTAACYRERALAAMDDILSRGKVPILVGGSLICVAAVTDTVAAEAVCTHDSTALKAVVRQSPSMSCPHDLLLLGVSHSWDEVERRMEERIETLLPEWIQEVEDLLLQGYHEKDPGMRTLGYRDIVRYLAERDQGEGDMDAMLETLASTIMRKMRQYAKRQLTWWKNDPRIRWVRP